MLSTLVSRNTPEGEIAASPWKIRFCWRGENLLTVKETVLVEFALVSSTRKKARERERTIEKLEVAMA